MNTRTKRGFTLVEIMAAVAIAIIALSLAAFYVAPAWRRSRATADLRQVASVKAAIESFYNTRHIDATMPNTEGTTVPHNTSFAVADVAKIATVTEILYANGVLLDVPHWSTSRDDNLPGGLSYSLTNHRWEGPGPLTNTDSLAATLETRISDPATSPALAQGANFRLGGPDFPDLPANVRVFYVRIPSIPAAQAYAFAQVVLKEVDGLPADDSVACAGGPLAYAAPVDGVTDLYLYVTHR